MIGIEVFSKHRAPDVVTIESDDTLNAARLLELVEDVVFFNFLATKFGRGFEES